MITQSYWKWYKNNINNLRLADLLTDNIKVALLSGAYTPFQSHTSYSDLTGELPTAGGYTAGGLTLTNKNVSNGAFTSANPEWSTTDTLSAFYFVVYNATKNTLWGYGTLNTTSGVASNVTVGANDVLRITLPSTGWFTITVNDGG